MSTTGERYAAAVAARDTDALVDLLADDVDFVGLTPGRTWHATTAHEVVDVVLGHWFEESDDVHSWQATEGEPVVDTRHVAYRFGVRNDEGPHVVEQQVYYREEDGRIAWARVLCSGFRPA